MSESETPRDFVWRYRLDEKPATGIYADPLLELIRVQWEELLKLTIATYQGVPLKIDGFRLMRDPGVTHVIFPDEVPVEGE